jgi:predicted O-linked N-acetylglucosamine transferase (SPINDLY family)
LGATLQGLGRLDEAVASYNQAIALKPDYATAHSNLGVTLQGLGRLDEAEASYNQAIALKPNYTEAHSNLLFLISGFNYEAPLYLKEAQDYGRKIADTVTSRFSSWSCEEESKTLRIGLVSGDLSNHPVGYFLEGLLNLLSRSNLDLFAYPTKLFEDDLTVRIKPYFAAWQPIVRISDEAAASLIHSDGIHILIDLSGHTAKNRLPIFAWKPAPIQISWLGYFASTGVAEIDYILGDPYVTPVEEADHFIEKIWQLPESYLCFTEPNVNVDVCPLPALANGSVMFGCFNSIERMNDNVVVVWASILKAIPDSRLFLKDKIFSDSAMRQAVYSRFELVGIGENRLILEGKSPHSEYLAAYNRVDIALSPFPYGGGTTSAEGLWMGVPVITKRGDHFLSHLGESIAHNTGLSNWIASDEDDYVAKAVEFSSNLDDLAILRSRLRAQVVSSPLFHTERFGNHFERALRDMWGAKHKYINSSEEESKGNLN